MSQIPHGDVPVGTQSSPLKGNRKVTFAELMSLEFRRSRKNEREEKKPSEEGPENTEKRQTTCNLS